LQGLVEQANGFVKKKLYAVKQLLGTSRWATACLIVAALINCTYHELIGCMPFRCLYRRDPWASALVAPALRATAEPPPDTEVSKVKDKDLNSNKEVLGPLLEENGDGQEAAE